MLTCSLIAISLPNHPRAPKSNAETDRDLNRDINNLIMDYLITEGYPSAARKFAAEANIQPKADFESINERVEIRDSIHRGDMQTAIEKINELNPQVCVVRAHISSLPPFNLR